jgi:hypothetical protein
MHDVATVEFACTLTKKYKKHYSAYTDHIGLIDLELLCYAEIYQIFRIENRILNFAHPVKSRGDVRVENISKISQEPIVGEGWVKP